MWEGDTHWMPQVLAGKTISGEMVYDQDQKLQKFKLSEMSS